MAKRRPLIDKDYSPVRAKLSQYRESAAKPAELRHAQVPPASDPVAEPTAEPHAAEPPPLEGPVEEPVARRRIEPEVAAAPIAEEPPEATPEVSIEAARRTLTKELRARCTDDEHEEWHDFAYEVTGKRNNFSAIFRACLALLEHAHTELEIRKPQMKSLKRPPKGKHLETALYEYELAQIVFDGLKAAGRPKDRILAAEGRTIRRE